VLFSQADVANFMMANFEPVWESVRPVPLVRIDFGNGNVLTRTLNGNIATYVCTADGQVLDILPGIYTKTAYLDQLGQFRLLAHFVDQKGKDQREALARAYHKAEAEALKKNEPPARLVRNMAVAMTKARIENPLKIVLIAGKDYTKFKTGAVVAGIDGPFVVPGTAREKPALESAEDVASWRVLEEDTRLNETLRRRQVHEMLAADGLVPPKQVSKRLYKEVLHADLDDPYLGLGPVLFASYPFKAEDVQ
jgi:hypothetical protein